MDWVTRQRDLLCQEIYSFFGGPVAGVLEDVEERKRKAKDWRMGVRRSLFLVRELDV